MKKILLTILLYLTYSSINAQITTSINYVFLNNQTNISNCNTLDFGATQNNSLTFYFKLSRPSSLPSGTGTLRIMLKYDSTSNPQVIGAPQNIQDSFWGGTIYESTIGVNISDSQVQVSGSTIYLEFETSGNIKTSSCEYPIIKTQAPTFTLSPTTLSIPCGSVAPVTFSYSNVYSTPGVTYNYSYSGWTFVSQTSNSITLKPTNANILPSNFSLVPIVNGVTQPYKVCTVTRAPFTSTATISGASSLCTSSDYTISNLQSGETVQWSLSSNTIASLSNSTANSVTVNKIGNGTVNLIATITNSCNQTTPVIKTINIGAPTFPNTNMSGDNNPLTGETIWYSVQSPTGYTSLQWYFDYAGTTGTVVNGWQILQGQGTTAIAAKVGNPGLTYVVCKAFNSCSNSIQYIPVSVRSITDPCDTFKINIKNPIKESDNLVGKIVPPPTDPCDDLYTKLIDKKEPKKIQVFDLFGRLVFSGEFVEDNFDLKLEKLTKGTYLLNITLQDGKIQHETIIIE